MTVLILSGAQGSGKSTICQKIADAIPTNLVSADQYFTSPEGEYRFDFARLGAAHAACMNRFIRAMQTVYNDRVVIVDNTNSTVVEVAPYYLVAKAFDHTVVHLTISAEPAAAHARNLHGVPLAGVSATAARVEGLELPPFWEVDKHVVDSDDLYSMTGGQIVDLLKLYR
jgi:shikimate kinase